MRPREQREGRRKGRTEGQFSLGLSPSKEWTKASFAWTVKQKKKKEDIIKVDTYTDTDTVLH